MDEISEKEYSSPETPPIIEIIEEKIETHSKIAGAHEEEAKRHQEIVADLKVVRAGLVSRNKLESKVLTETESENSLAELTTREEVTPPPRDYPRKGLFEKLVRILSKDQTDYDPTSLIECDWSKVDDETRKFQRFTDREARIVILHHLYEQRKTRLKYREAEEMLIDGIVYVATECLEDQKSPSENKAKLLSEKQSIQIINDPQKALDILRNNKRLYDSVLTRLAEVKKEEFIKRQTSPYGFPEE